MEMLVKIKMKMKKKNAKVSVKDTTAFSRDFTLGKPVDLDNKRITNVLNALNLFNNNYFDKWIALDLNGDEIKNGITSLPKTIVLESMISLINPTKDGYVFRGWYLDPEFKLKFNEETDDVSTAKVLYAKWAIPVTVTFIYGAEKVEKSMTNDENIEYPYIEAYYMCNAEWCTRGKKECNPVKSNKDIELFLIRTPQEFALSFNTSGGAEISSKSIAFGSLIGELPKPEKEGYVFQGWFADPELKYPFYTERMPDRNICLHAKWESPPINRIFSICKKIVIIVVIIIAVVKCKKASNTNERADNTNEKTGNTNEKADITK